MAQIRRMVWTPLAVGLLAACPGSDPAGPPWRAAPVEALPLTVTARLPGSDGPVPSAGITGGAGTIAIDVHRDAECNVQADAAMRRSGREIDIIAHVETNMLSSCAEVPVVLNYKARLTGLDAGTYRVRLYETFMGGPPRLVLSKAVSVEALPR